MAIKKMRRAGSIASFFRTYRSFMGYSQSDLAGLLGVHPQYISNIERGINQRPFRLVKRLIPMLSVVEKNNLLDLMKESASERLICG